MVSLNPGPNRFFASRSSLADSDSLLSIPCFCAFNPRNSLKNCVNFASLSLLAARKCDGLGLGLLKVKQKRGSCSWCRGILRRCKSGNKGWDSEGNDELEAEILEFMKNSEKPGMFPNKKELIGAGRMDLVEAIVKHGGWLAMGWDMDVDEEEGKKEGNTRVQSNDNVRDWDLNIEQKLHNDCSQERNRDCSSVISNSTADSRSSSLASKSGISLKVDAESDSGIEGILSRLEKERNLSLGLSLRDKENSYCANICQNSPLPQSSTDMTVIDLQTTSEPEFNCCKSLSEQVENKFQESNLLSAMDGLTNSPKPETWRTWSMRRAGFSDAGFEAAEISPGCLNGGKKNDVQENDFLDKNGVSSYSTKGRDMSNPFPEEINQSHIKSRLEHLQSELSSTLHSLRSHNSGVVSSKDGEVHTGNSENLSDAFEFRENETMKARDKLRSTRAKLAVVEGKMAMAIIDARRIVEEKQERIDHARRALRILRTACIIWPNSASEVLLAGSFDGWSTQRKMERSNHGVFSLWLKLYPGKYQIKFIVDGQWKVDPLRPIVNYDGYENNLLIIT